MENNEKCKVVTLEERLTAATFDPSCRPQFYKWLPTSFVYTGVNNRQKSGCKFSTVRRSGDEYVAVFTSEKMVPSKYKVVRAKFEDFLQLIDDRGISLNPGQPVTKDFSEEELRAIQSGELCKPTLFERGSVNLSEHFPPVKSRVLWKDVSSLLKNHPSVVSAWSSDAIANSRRKSPITTWIGIISSTTSAWKIAAQECTILLSTLDNPPPSFKIERLDSPDHRPPSSECFYEKGLAEDQRC